MKDTSHPLEYWKDLKMPSRYFAGKFNSLTGQPSVDFYNDKTWLFNSAKMLNKWAIGEELTEEQFDAGIEKALNHVPQ